MFSAILKFRGAKRRKRKLELFIRRYKLDACLLFATNEAKDTTRNNDHEISCSDKIEPMMFHSLLWNFMLCLKMRGSRTSLQHKKNARQESRGIPWHSSQSPGQREVDEDKECLLVLRKYIDSPGITGKKEKERWARRTLIRRVISKQDQVLSQIQGWFCRGRWREAVLLLLC